MDSVYTELSEHLDGSVKMKKATRTQTRSNYALVMIVRRQFSAYLTVQESFKRPELHNVVFHPWYVSYLWDWERLSKGKVAVAIQNIIFLVYNDNGSLRYIKDE